MVPLVVEPSTLLRRRRRARPKGYALSSIGFSQTAGDARTFAKPHGYRIDIGQESVAQGAANLGAGVFQRFTGTTRRAAETPVRQVVIEFGGVNFIDSQGWAEINRAISLGEAHGVELRLAPVKPEVRTVLAGDGVEHRLGSDHPHANLDEAVTVAAAVLDSAPR